MDLTKEEEEVIRKMREEKVNKRQAEVLDIVEALKADVTKSVTKEQLNAALFTAFEKLEPELHAWAESIWKDTTKAAAEATSSALYSTVESLKDLIVAFTKQ